MCYGGWGSGWKRCWAIRLTTATADRGVFADELARWSIDFEKASRPESVQGFVPVAKRWVVERTIGWTNFFRRIVKDYEYTVLPLRRPGSVSWLYLANIQIMLQRIQA